jgi:hypothetical protein
MEKEIYYFIRRIENAILQAAQMAARVGTTAEPIFAEGLLCLNEAKHHFAMAQIAEGE